MAWGGHASGRSGVCRILPGSPASSRRVPWPRPQGPRRGTPLRPGNPKRLPVREPALPEPGSAEPAALDAAPGWGPRAVPPAVAPAVPSAAPRGPSPSFQLQQAACRQQPSHSHPPGTAGAHLARGHRWRGAPSPARCPPVGRARPAPPQAALGGSGPDSDPSPGSDPDLGPGAGPGPDPARPGPAGQKRGPRRQGAGPAFICIPARSANPRAGSD